MVLWSFRNSTAKVALLSLFLQIEFVPTEKCPPVSSQRGLPMHAPNLSVSKILLITMFFFDMKIVPRGIKSVGLSNDEV